jgi:hypothetical protein
VTAPTILSPTIVTLMCPATETSPYMVESAVLTAMLTASVTTQPDSDGKTRPANESWVRDGLVRHDPRGSSLSTLRATPMTSRETSPSPVWRPGSTPRSPG